MFVTALMLANTGRLNEKRAARRPTATEATRDDDTSTGQQPVEIELVDLARKARSEEETHAPRPPGAEKELEQGEQGHVSPPCSPHEEEKIEEPLSSWTSSLLVLGNSALCGDDGATPPIAP